MQTTTMIMSDASESDDVRELSALRENIQKKGKNAYYYAHGPKIDGPVWDGKEEPRLMASQSAIASSSSEKVITYASFDSFAWVDGTKNVKIYIDFDCADEIPDDDLLVEKISSTSVEFSLCKNEKHYKFVLDSLSGSIVSASVKKKSDKFILTLLKDEEKAWYELRSSKK